MRRHGAYDEQMWRGTACACSARSCPQLYLSNGSSVAPRCTGEATSICDSEALALPSVARPFRHSSLPISTNLPYPSARGVNSEPPTSHVPSRAIRSYRADSQAQVISRKLCCETSRRPGPTPWRVMAPQSTSTSAPIRVRPSPREINFESTLPTARPQGDPVRLHERISTPVVYPLVHGPTACVPPAQRFHRC